MKKLSSELLNNCTIKNCCIDELVILPPEGDVGFEEYYNYKAEMIRDAKNIFSPAEENKLMLAYPKSDSREPYIFEKFFESPSIVARNRDFEGCFAIDISAYIGKTDDEYFDKLMAYMHSNPNIVFLLFMYSDNKNEIENMYDFLFRYDEIRMLSIPLPDASTLTEYTVSIIKEFCPDIDDGIDEYLLKFFTDMECGYDLADYLVRYLKYADFSGDLQTVKEATDKADDAWNIHTGFGYY